MRYSTENDHSCDDAAVINDILYVHRNIIIVQYCTVHRIILVRTVVQWLKSKRFKNHTTSNCNKVIILLCTMEKGLLPTIASSHNSTSRLELEMKAEQASAIPTKFEQVLEKLNNTYFPAIDPDISVKARISILEGTAHSQKEYNKQNVESFATLSNDINLMDQNLKKIIIDMQMDFEKRLTLFKKEYDHR